MSITSALEILTVARGGKPAARVSVGRDMLRSVSTETQRLGLSVLPGFEELQPSGNHMLAREWASFGPGLYRNSAKMKSYLYVAADRDLAEQLRNADERCDIAETGRLLGYPSCCNRMFQEIARHPPLAGNPVFFIYENGLVANWLMNVCLLDDDCALITHVPCGPNCLGSLRLARSAFSVLFDASPEQARVHCDRLSGSILYGSDGSYVQLSTSGRDVCSRKIDRVRKQSGCHVLLADQLLGSKLRIDSGGVRIDALHLLDDQFRFYQFI